MRAVVQRVERASVDVGSERTGEIATGFMVLLGVMEGDTEKDADYIVKKISGLRVFEDADDKLNLTLKDVGGSVLMVSQFTLAGDARHGNRPSFSHAAAPAEAEPLFEYTVNALKLSGLAVETGRFRTHMRVELVNDGPVTILLDSTRLF